MENITPENGYVPVVLRTFEIYFFEIGWMPVMKSPNFVEMLITAFRPGRLQEV